MQSISCTDLSTKRRNLFASITRYLDPQVGKVAILATPAAGKSTLARDLVTRGLAVIDTDDLFFDWDKKLKKKENVAGVKGRFPELVENMTGWSIPGSMMVTSVQVVVTNLHNTALSYLSRSGAGIVQYVPSEEDFMRNLDSRNLSDIDKKKFLEWYKEHVEQQMKFRLRKDDRWCFDTTVNSIDEISFLVYAPNYNCMGDAGKIERGGRDVKEGHVFARSLRRAIMYRVRESNKTYLSLGPGPSEIVMLSNYIGRSKCVGYHRRIHLTIPFREAEVLTTSYPFGGSKYNDVWNILSYVGADVNLLVYDGNLPKTEKGRVIKTLPYDGIHPKEDFSFVINRHTYDYNLPEVTAHSTDYIDQISRDFDLIDKMKRNRKCKRIVYFLVVRNIFSKPLIPRVSGSIIYLPFTDYSSTRVAVFWDRNLSTDISVKSLSECYLMILSFNTQRFHYGEKYENEAFKVILNAVTLNKNFLSYRANSREFPVGLFSLSNSMNNSDNVYKYIRAVCKRQQCLFNLPNSRMQKYICTSENNMSTGELVTTHDDGVVYRDGLYEYSKFLSYPKCYVYNSRDIVWMSRTYMKNRRWYVREMEPCNGNSPLFNLWFFVGNIGQNTFIQNHANSQSHLMRPMAQLIRYNFGMDSNAVYNKRSFVAKERDDTIIPVVSSKGTYMTPNGDVYAVPGHLINLMLISEFEVIDFKRMFDILEGNYKYLTDAKFKSVYKTYVDSGDVAEWDSVDQLWHHPLDLLDLVEVVQQWADLLDFRQISYTYVKVRIKQLIGKYKDLVSATRATELFVK